MKFPEHVLEAYEQLKKSNDDRVSTMALLITPRDSDSDICPILIDYKKMWRTLYKAESERKNVSNNMWVFSFLDAVTAAKSLPEYVYMNGESRITLLSRINESTKKLQKIYTSNKYDQNLILNDGFFSHGFSSIDEHGNTRNAHEKISIVDVLEFFANSLMDDITLADRLVQAGRDVESRMFIRHLAKRNVHRYGKPLNGVVGISSWCIYGQYYPPSTVSNALNRAEPLSI